MVLMVRMVGWWRRFLPLGSFVVDSGSTGFSRFQIDFQLITDGEYFQGIISGFNWRINFVIIDYIGLYLQNKSHLESWVSGLNQQFAKLSYASKRTGGSNPPLSTGVNHTSQ